MTNDTHLFIHTPYESGVSLRADVYARQFSVIVLGTTEYPEDDPTYGTYTRDESFSVCIGATLTDVINETNDINHCDAWSFRDDDKDYYDSDLGHDCGPISFSAHFVVIYDRYHRKVIGGRVSQKGILWTEPVKSEIEAIALRQRRDELYSEAAFEAGWDNFSTARNLRREATALLLADVASCWRGHPEVLMIAAKSPASVFHSPACL